MGNQAINRVDVHWSSICDSWVYIADSGPLLTVQASDLDDAIREAIFILGLSGITPDDFNRSAGWTRPGED